MNIHPISRVIRIAMILSILSGCSEIHKDSEEKIDGPKRLEPSKRHAEASPKSPKKNDAVPGSPLEDGLQMTIADAPDDLDCADLCIRLDKKPSRRGEGVKGEIKWMGMPEGSGLVLFFTRKPDSSSDEYHGPTGAIVKQPKTLPTRGVLQFEWNGQSFACAPVDKMELCSQRPAPGIYNITAVIFDRSDFELIGKTEGKAPQRVYGAGSEYFTITGRPELKLIADDLRSGGHRKTAAGNNRDDAAGTWEDAAVRQRGSDWCATFKMKPPGKERMIVCAPQKAVMNEVGQRKLSDRDIQIIKSF